MVNKKYEIDKTKYRKSGDSYVYRIKALRDIPLSDGSVVKAGKYGGYIESEDNLSHTGNSWVKDSAVVRDYAVVSGDAIVSGTSEVYDESKVFGSAQVHSSNIYSSIVKDKAFIHNLYITLSTVGGSSQVVKESDVYQSESELNGDSIVYQSDVDEETTLDNETGAVYLDTNMVIPEECRESFDVVNGRPKYEMVPELNVEVVDQVHDKLRNHAMVTSRTLFQVRALKDLRLDDGRMVNTGELGGFIESYDNLSQDGSAWIDVGSRVYGDSEVVDDSIILGDSAVVDTKVKDKSRIESSNVSSSIIEGGAKVVNSDCSRSVVSSRSIVSGSKIDMMRLKGDSYVSRSYTEAYESANKPFKMKEVFLVDDQSYKSEHDAIMADEGLESKNFVAGLLIAEAGLEL